MNTKSNKSIYDIDPISVGKTLLQAVMESKKDTLQLKLEAYNNHKKECQLLNKEFNIAKGNSKALPGQYSFKQFSADDSRKRQNVHHTGSHYVMAASSSRSKGTIQGLTSRHSKQGASLQASRMAARDVARVQQGGGATKNGKTSSRKSKQKSNVGIYGDV